MKFIAFLTTFMVLIGCSTKKDIYIGALAKDIINTSNESLDSKYDYIMYRGLKYYIIDDVNKDVKPAEDNCYKGKRSSSMVTLGHAIIEGKSYAFAMRDHPLNDGSCRNIKH